jgi:hypothetical protein
MLIFLLSLNLFASGDYSTFKTFKDLEKQYQSAKVVSSTTAWKDQILRAGRCYKAEIPHRALGAALAHKRDSQKNSLISITWGPFPLPADRYDRMSLREYESLGVNYVTYSLENGEFFHQEMGLLSSLRTNQRFIFEELRESPSNNVLAYCVYKTPQL